MESVLLVFASKMLAPYSFFYGLETMQVQVFWQFVQDHHLLETAWR